MKLRIALSIALSAVLAPALVPPPAVATVPPVAAVEFTRTSQWATGYVGTLTVRNTTGATTSGWRLEFDLGAETRITSSWNGTLTRTGDRYQVVNETWNGTLAPGASAAFGFVAEGSGTPANCTLNGAPCSGAPASDYTAPTRPGPLTISVTTDVTLRWGASTDDRGPVRYEVYESGRLLATVTDTAYVYATGPALPPRIYVFFVRAVDAAGNVSASAWQTIGRVWRGDEVPPAPGSPRYTPVSPTHFRLDWAAAEVPSQLTVPPVAGYEVSVDGRPVSRVGAPRITLPVMGGGPHVVSVRTINAVDQLSEPVQITIG